MMIPDTSEFLQYQKELDELSKYEESLKHGFRLATPKPEDTPIGRIELELSQMRHDIEEYRSVQEAYQKANDEQNALDRKKNIKLSIITSAISGTIASTIAGLIIYYWPDITAFFAGIFQ